MAPPLKLLLQMAEAWVNHNPPSAAVSEDPNSALLRKHAHQELHLDTPDYTLDDADLEILCPLDNRRHVINPRHAVGKLDVLPAELLAPILQHLDLPTLTAFRRVNHRAMSIVDSLPQYKAVVKHCPDVLRAAICLEATSFSCSVLYETLSTSQCDTCDKFGDYLYLITCRRACYHCYMERPEYLPLPLRLARRETGLSSPREIKKMAHVQTLPAPYNHPFFENVCRDLMFDRQAVLGTSPRTSIWCSAEQTIQQEIQTRGAAERRMAIISAPHLGSSGQEADWGFYCAQCWARVSSRTKFTRGGVLEHLRAEHGEQ